MQEVKNKQGEILGTYELTEILKADTYIVNCTDSNGNSLEVTKEITKEDILKLASQQFNTNIRNYIAGLARPKTGSKLAVLEEYMRTKGINIKGVSATDLIEKLKELA